MTDPIALPDGAADPVGAAECADRVRRVQQRLADRGWSALVVADPANLYYLCGYNAWSFYMPQCLVVPADGDPHLFLRAMDAGGAHWTTRLPAGQVHGYPEELVHRSDTHPYVWITDQARAVGALPTRPGAVVAAELDAHFFTVRAYAALADGLAAGGSVVDSGELVNWERVVKSSAEMDALRQAGRITTAVMTTALAALREGRRQCDVVAEIAAAQAHGVADVGGDYPAIVPMLPTGESAGTPHLTWTDQPLRRGAASTIELAAAYRRYHVPLARTVSLGPPPSRLAHCADAVAQAREAALTELVPGRRAQDAHAAFSRVLAAHGLTKDSRIGYSIGIGYPPDWGERTVSLRGDDQTMLAPGMAFHVIFGMWMDGWGYETSESVLLTDAGAERLTDVPQDLTIKD